MAAQRPRKPPRRQKSSRLKGVKKRWGCLSVDMRCDRRHWEVSGFATEELAGLAHDFFRLLSRKGGNLNFPGNRESLVQFAEQHGMERFKVIPKEAERNWAADKKNQFMDLLAEAHNQIKSAGTASAEESLEGAEAAGVQELAADIVQGSNNDQSHMRTNSEEYVGWDVNGALASTGEAPAGFYKWFCSRDSESAIHPDIAELEALLSAEAEEKVELKTRCDDLQAQLDGVKAQRDSLQAENEHLAHENEHLAQQLAGLPSVYKHLWESVPPGYETPREAEPRSKADSSQILSSPLNHIYTRSGKVKDATTFLPQVYEPEARLSKGVQQNCLLRSLSEDDAPWKVENWGYHGAVGEQSLVTSGEDWNSFWSGIGVINTFYCGSWDYNIGVSGTPDWGLNVGLSDTDTIDISVHESGGFSMADLEACILDGASGQRVSCRCTSPVEAEWQNDAFRVEDVRQK